MFQTGNSHSTTDTCSTTISLKIFSDKCFTWTYCIKQKLILPMVFPKDVIFSGANLSEKEILESHRNRAKNIEREPFLVGLFEGKFGCYTPDTQF